MPERGTLFVVPPIEPTSRTLQDAFALHHVACRHGCLDGLLEVECDAAALQSICKLLETRVQGQEQRDTKCLFLPQGEALDMRHMLRMQPLEQLMHRVNGQWLMALLEEERLETWFQPIVHAANPSDVFGYECLVRGRSAEGSIVSPGDMFGIASKADLLFQLDRACRLSAVRSAHAHAVSRKIFINFVPTTIYRPEACLQTTFEALRTHDIAPEQVVFEVTESEQVRDVEHLCTILDYYRSHGFSTALDDLGAGYSSLNLLSRLKPEFMKLDMALIRDVDTDPYKAAITSNCIAMGRQLGIASIAEGIETAGELRWLQEAGVDFLQGYHIARPAPVPARLD